MLVVWLADTNKIVVTVHVRAYYLHVLQVDLPADVFYPVIFATATYFTVGLNPNIRAFIVFVVITSLNVLVGQGLGMLMSAIFMDLRNAQVLASTLILISLVSSGYLIDPENVPTFMKFLGYISPIKFCYEGLVRNEMSYGREFECNRNENLSTIYSENGQVCPLTKSSVLNGAQLANSPPVWANSLILLSGVIITRVLAYFALKALHTAHKPRMTVWSK